MKLQKVSRKKLREIIWKLYRKPTDIPITKEEQEIIDEIQKNTEKEIVLLNEKEK